MSAGLILFLIVSLAIIIGWHLFFPIVGGIIAFTAVAWGILVASVIIFCVAILLVFIFTGTGIFILGAIGLAWMLLAVFFFPLVFPIVFPLFVLFIVVSHFLRKRKYRELESRKNNGSNPPPTI